MPVSDTQLTGVAPDTVTGQDQSVAYNQSMALSNLFTVMGATPTQYQVWLDGPASGSVTDVEGAIATNTVVNETSLAGLNYIGGLTEGSDVLWLRSFDGQWSNWVQVSLTDPGAVTANNQTVAYNQSVALSSLFTVTGGGSITSYNVWFNGSPDGSVTNNGAVIATGQTVNVASLANLNYAGGVAAGTDQLWVQAVTATGKGNWVLATLTDTGAVTANNQTVAYNQSVALSSLFTVAGGGSITSYNVWFNDAPDGSVTNNGAAIVTGQTVNVSSLANLNYVGGVAAGTDQLWVQAVTATGNGNWVLATLTDPGAVTGNDPTVAYNQSVALSSLFTVAGGGSITSYNVWLNASPDGSVTNNGAAIPAGQTVNVSSLANLNYAGGVTAGTDQLWVQAVTATGKGNWALATLIDTGAVTANNQTVAYNQSVALSSLFTVTDGGSIASYNVWLNESPHGSVTNNGAAIVTGQAVNVSSLANLNYVGGVAAGTDQLWVQAVTATGTGNWVLATLVDTGAPSVAWSSGSVAGTEGAAIPLSTLAATTNGQGNTLQSLVISAIPVGAVLSDGTHSFTAIAGSTSVNVAGWTLASLAITPPNDTSFTLTATATEQNAAGMTSSASANEAVIVDPLAPSVAWSTSSVSGTAGSAIALSTLSDTINGLSGDSNSLQSLMLAGLPAGVTLADGTHSFTAATGSTSVNVAGWDLSHLTLMAASAMTFSLTATATEQSAGGSTSDASANETVSASANEAVTVNAATANGTPEFPNLFNSYAVRPSWQVAGVDYYVGAPAGTAFLDPSTINMHDVSVDTVNHFIRIWNPDGANVTLNGYDFSASGGWLVYIYQVGGTITIENSNFNGSPGAYEIDTAAQSYGNLVVQNNTMNGNANNQEMYSLISDHNSAGTLTVQNNYMTNTAHMIEISSGTLIDQYNLQVYGGGTYDGTNHVNFTQFSGGTVTNSVIQYNTLIEPPYVAGQATGEMIQVQVQGGSITNTTVNNNTLIAQPGSAPTISTGIDIRQSSGALDTVAVTNNYIDPSAMLNPIVQQGTITGLTQAGNINMLTGQNIPF
jgi:hypothetical protein